MMKRRSWCGEQHILRAGISASLMMLSCIQGVSHAQTAGNAGVGGEPVPGDHPGRFKPLPPPPADAEPPSPDPRNFEGIWLANSNPRDVGGAPGFGPPPPYTPEAASKQQHAAEMRIKGTPLTDSAANCRPMTSLRLGFDIYPAEIIQTAQKVVILNEEGRGRWEISLNRDHPKNVQPSYFGDSVGHWEGDTLVVDTIGLNGEIGLLSTKARVTSRFRKINGGRQLELTLIIEDPVNYTTPFKQTVTSTWHPELSLLEYQCEENREGALEGLTKKQ